MKYEFMSIPVVDSASGQDALNKFVGQHRVVEVQRHLVPQPGGAIWAICVTYVDGEEPLAVNTTAPERRSKVDYRKILSPDDFDIFARLREVRKNQALPLGVPLYSVFNNKHLSEMVLQRMSTRADLESLPGVGTVRAQKYAEPFLDVLNAAWRELPPEE